MRTAAVLFLLIAPLSGEETWSELRLEDKHIGWSHETSGMMEEERDQPLRVTVEEGKGWFGEPAEEFRWRTEYAETPDGKPVGFSYQGWQGDKPLPEVHGKADATGMTFAVVEGEKKTSEIHAEDFLFPHGARLLVKSKGFAPGTKYSYRTFSVDDKALVQIDAEVVGEAEIALPEGPAKGHFVKQTQKGSILVPFDVHYDDEGNTLCLNGTDIQMVLIRSTRERATAVPGHENK